MYHVCFSSPPVSHQSCILRVLQQSFRRYWWSSFDSLRVCATLLPAICIADGVSTAPVSTIPFLRMVACFEIRLSCCYDGFTFRKTTRAWLLFLQCRKVLLTGRSSPRTEVKERSTTQHWNSVAFLGRLVDLKEIDAQWYGEAHGKAQEQRNVA